MAATGTITISGTVVGLASGSKTLGPSTISAAAAVGQTTDIVLASGFNAITVPAGASACIINFAAASTTTKTLKGINADTGFEVTKVGVVVIQFNPASLPSFGITSSGADTGNTTEITFI